MKKFLIMFISLFLVCGCSNSDIDKVIDTKSNNLIDVSDTSKVSNQELVDYFNNILNEVNDLIDDKNSENTLKNTFITLTDFILYNGKIKGVSFDDLDSLTQSKILDIYDDIDNKIEKKYPNYKESLRVKGENEYNNIKGKVSDIRSRINSEIEDVYSNYESSKDKVTDTYNKALDKASSIYNQYKES